MAYSTLYGDGFKTELGEFTETIPPIGDEIPDEIHNLHSQQEDVNYSEETLRTLKNLGYYSVGAGILLYEVDAGDIRFMLAKHKASEKLPEPAWSIPTETSQYRLIDHSGSKKIQVETMMQTVLRCFDEELGYCETPSPIVLPAVTRWSAVDWEVSPNSTKTRKAFVPVAPIGLVFGMGTNHAQDFTSSENNEISELRMFSPDDFRQYGTGISTRYGIMEAFSQLMIIDTLRGLGSGRLPLLHPYNLFTNPETDEELEILFRNDSNAIKREDSDDWQDLILPDLEI